MTIFGMTFCGSLRPAPPPDPLFLRLNINDPVFHNFLGQDLVPEQEIKIEEDH